MLCRTLIALSLVFVAQTCFSADARTVELQQISTHVWIHTSYSLINGQLVDSHGMIVVTQREIVLVDTCWNDDQTDKLLAKLNEKFHVPVSFAIITHAHQDRIGGIGSLVRNSIKVVSTPLTARKATLAGYLSPLPELDSRLTHFSLLASDSIKVEVEVFYPGPGHTEDNIVVWIPSDRALFGGCLVKATENTNLGNTADAFVDRWASAIKELQIRYSDAKVVIPGHGRIGESDLMRHTIDLIDETVNEE